MVHYEHYGRIMYVLCAIHNALCTIHNELCTIHNVLCTLWQNHNTLCMNYVHTSCIMLIHNVLCNVYCTLSTGYELTWCFSMILQSTSINFIGPPVAINLCRSGPGCFSMILRVCLLQHYPIYKTIFLIKQKSERQAMKQP